MIMNHLKSAKYGPKRYKNKGWLSKGKNILKCIKN